VGARSAIFAPMATSAWSWSTRSTSPPSSRAARPRYHARDVRVERARQAARCAWLGSATPSLESWHEAQSGGYGALRLATRIGRAGLPRSTWSTCAWRARATRSSRAAVWPRARGAPGDGAVDPVPEPARLHAGPLVPGLRGCRCAARTAR
jgi:primosomal protein N'